jgi:hypothetical protein
MKKQALNFTVIISLLVFGISCKPESGIKKPSGEIIAAKGWRNAGNEATSYKMGIEEGAGRAGNPAATIKSIENNIKGFGTLMQSCLPGKFLGKRVRMSGFMKSVDVKGWAGFWLRVDPKLGFDNMKNGKKDISVTGTTDWKNFEIVLDVPQNATNLSYGALLSGTGQIWFENIAFEIVDNSVEITGKDLWLPNQEPEDLLFEQTKELAFVAEPNVHSAEKWFEAGDKADSYLMGIQTGTGQEGRNAAMIKSTKENIKGFGTLMQQCLPGKYLGKKIKMSGYMKSKDVADWAGFWLRVDKEFAETPLAFDNMQNRAITGTTGWKKYEITLDVPSTASNIAYGGLLSGTGQIWFENITFEIVGDAAPASEEKVEKQNDLRGKIEAEPINLNFENYLPKI